MSMLWLLCELTSQNLALPIEIDIFGVVKVRYSLYKDSEAFKYLLDAFGLDNTWIILC